MTGQGMGRIMASQLTEDDIVAVANFCLWVLYNYHDKISAPAIRTTAIDQRLLKHSVPQSLVNTAVKRLLANGYAESGDDWIISITWKGRQFFDDIDKEMDKGPRQYQETCRKIFAAVGSSDNE